MKEIQNTDRQCIARHHHFMMERTDIGRHSIAKGQTIVRKKQKIKN